MLLTDLIADVIANPAVYADKFPLPPEPEPSVPTLTVPHIPADWYSGAVLTPGMFAQALDQLHSHALPRNDYNSYARPPRGADITRIDNVGPERDRVYMANLPFRRDSVAQQVMDEVLYGRVNMPRWEDGDTEFIRDEAAEEVELQRTIDYVKAEMEGDGGLREDARAANRTATGALIERDLDRASRRLNQIAFGDSHGYYLPSRPDHYLVRRCACGFTSMFTAAMESHLTDRIENNSHGIPCRWRVCERCGVSALCRRVAVANLRSPSFDAGPIDPVGPAVSEAYHCDHCTR